MRRFAWLGVMLLVGCGASQSNDNGGSCSDFVLDGNESDVDCGGSCAPCGSGRVCFAGADCASGLCSSGRCLDQAVQPVDVSDVLTIDSGVAIDIVPGSQAGYGITAAVGGGSFRLVWTGDGSVTNQYHEFYGTLYTAGAITSVASGCGGECSFGSGDYLSAPYSITGGMAVDFDSFAVNDLDGIDIVVADVASGTGEPLYFDLFIDGAHHPELVFFPSPGTTSGINSPSTLPFGLATD